MAGFIDQVQAASEEHEAWQKVVEEWNVLHPQPGGFNLNGKICQPLVKAIELWGERLVGLRVQQDSVDRVIALQDKINAYADAKAGV